MIMELNNILPAKNRTELRAWLTENHNTEPECWVIIKRGKPSPDKFWYVDAVEEALCFGWIDSTLRKLASGENAQRLMPRAKNSHWTELNKERCRRLERLGLMTDAGRSVIPDLNEPFHIRDDILNALQSDPVAWMNFQSFPTLYQRIRIDNIQGYKRSKEETEKQLQRLIETAHAGVMFGQWNDYGRLTEE